MTSKFMYSGQTCTAPKRIFVHRSVYEEFLDRFEERAARLVLGEPQEERTDISPVASSLAVARIRAQLSDAVAKGANIILGGKEAKETVEGLAGEPYCHPVPGYTFGKFGTIALNQTRAESWKGAFVVKAVGGYGYSGWIWETADGAFRIKQGPKLLSLETAAENGE